MERILTSECPGIWIRLQRHEWPKSCNKIADPVVLLERNLYGRQEDGVPKASPQGSRTCLCANTCDGTRRKGKGEFTSCRHTVWSAWEKTSSETHRRKNRAARKGKWSPRGIGMTVLTYPCHTASRYRWQ